MTRRMIGVLFAIVSLAVPQIALADADPASDVLLGAPAFYPFQPPVSQALQNELQQELAQLQKQGLNLKVAIIESPVDLGAIPNLFGKPETYALFLNREISFQGPQPVLVVMPAGFGVADAGPPTALAGLQVDQTGASNGLTQSAILAVQRIAKATGKTLSTGGARGGASSSGGSSPAAIAGIVALLVVLAVAIAVFRYRRNTASKIRPRKRPPRARS